MSARRGLSTPPAIACKHELALGQLSVLRPVLAEGVLGGREGDAKHNHLGGSLGRRALRSRQTRIGHVPHHGARRGVFSTQSPLGDPARRAR